MSSVADCIPQSGLEFGYCGVSQTTSKTLTLTNPNQSNVRFEITAENIPFEFSTLKGNFFPPHLL